MKTLYLIISFSVAGALLIQIFLEPHYGAIRLVLLSAGRGNLIIALNLLPFMLMVLRLRMLFHHPNPRITRWLILSTDLLFLALVTGLTWYILTFAPYGGDRRQPLSFEERLSVPERQRSVEISSPVSIGRLLVRGDGYLIDQTVSATRFSARLPYPEKHLGLELQRRSFLGRAIYQATIRPWQTPERVDVQLRSPEAIVLYDAGLPVTQSADRRGLTIHVGRNPPNPLRFTFTVPAQFTGELSVRTHYYAPPYEARLPAERYDVDYHLSAVARYPIGGGGE